MNASTAEHFASLRSQDRDARYRAFMQLLEATQTPVDWAYEVWDDLVRDLADEDNHMRAIAAQLLCNLAKSDPRGRILNDFDALLAVTRDERFVTARHSLQVIWKVGVAGERQRQRVLEGLALRFGECASERNCTLIRYDIAKALRDLYDEVKDERIRELAGGLINSEDDSKYRKKYEAVWRGV
jgi:hypothetical protein